MNIMMLPNTGLAPSNADIANHLREQADWLEEPDAAAIQTAFIVFERCDGSIYRQTVGFPCDRARAIGVLQMHLIQNAIGADE